MTFSINKNRADTQVRPYGKHASPLREPRQSKRGELENYSPLGVVEKAPLTRGVGGQRDRGGSVHGKEGWGGVGGNSTLPVPLALPRLETNPPGPCQGGKGHAPDEGFFNSRGFVCRPTRGITCQGSEAAGPLRGRSDSPISAPCMRQTIRVRCEPCEPSRYR